MYLVWIVLIQQQILYIYLQHYHRLCPIFQPFLYSNKDYKCLLRIFKRLMVMLYKTLLKQNQFLFLIYNTILILTINVLTAFTYVHDQSIRTNIKAYLIYLPLTMILTNQMIIFSLLNQDHRNESALALNYFTSSHSQLGVWRAVWYQLSTV